MATQNDIISILEEKIKRVLLAAQVLENSNLQLRRQVNELSEAVRVKDLKIKDLELECQNLKFAKAVASSQEDIRQAKHQIDGMVHEIDRCIALLNK